jgi:hypothetical protein
MEKRCEHFIHPKVELLSSGTATCNIRLTCNTSNQTKGSKRKRTSRHPKYQQMDLHVSLMEVGWREGEVVVGAKLTEYVQRIEFFLENEQTQTH